MIDEIKNELEKYALSYVNNIIIPKIKKVAAAKRMYNSGEFINKMYSKLISGISNFIVIEIHSTDYAGYISGEESGFPPGTRINGYAIIDWINNKNIKFRNPKYGEKSDRRRKIQQFSGSIMSAERAAYSISQFYFKYGKKKNFFVNLIVNQHIPIIKQEIDTLANKLNIMNMEM